MKKISPSYSASSFVEQNNLILNIVRKQFLQLLSMLLLSVVCLPAFAQLSSSDNSKMAIQGSIKSNPDPNKIDVVFKSSYNSKSGEYVHYLQFSVAIPARGTEKVTATAIGVNAFANMGTLSPIEPYVDGSERIFGWVFIGPNPATQSWLNDKAFSGIEVTFSQSDIAASSKLVNFTNKDGGKNINTYFIIYSTSGDLTNYNNLYFQMPTHNQLGTYTNKDQFVQLRKNVTPTELDANQLTVSSFPNPYEKGFKLNIISPVSGMATIQFFNTNGSKVYEVKQQVEAKINQAVDVKNTTSFNSSVFYKITVNDYSVTGTVVKQ